MIKYLSLESCLLFYAMFYTILLSSTLGNCDPSSGVCLKCIFDTEGEHCEHCKAGFFGNAVGGMCSECTCNMLGTDQANYDCDRVTGKCNCLPNVIGDNCDK